MIDLRGTPYSIDGDAERSLSKDLNDLAERVELLRRAGTLTDETLALYYGEKRFEQVAESNAIEGSTLSVGETELAVMKGVTISGHDPGYSRDAQTLFEAIMRLAELARTRKPTDNLEIKELHEIILGDRPGAGMFRKDEVRISGSKHRPPRTWTEVMSQMEHLEAWSQSNPSMPAVVRSVVLHAWLTHIHPFIDGNGRTARAIGNLELIRAGYPPIIIRRRKDRDRYIEALAASDDAGNLAFMFDLVMSRIDDSLRDLERAAGKAQGYDLVAARVRRAQEGRLAIWQAAVNLLVELISFHLHQRLDSTGAKLNIPHYRDTLTVDEYVALCEYRPIGGSWLFRIDCGAPALRPVVRLAWAGFRSLALRQRLPEDSPPGPALFWSVPNPNGYPPWIQTESDAPGGAELILVDEKWVVRRAHQIRTVTSRELAELIAADIVNALLRTK